MNSNNLPWIIAFFVTFLYKNKTKQRLSEPVYSISQTVVSLLFQVLRFCEGSRPSILRDTSQLEESLERPSD